MAHHYIIHMYNACHCEVEHVILKTWKNHHAHQKLQTLIREPSEHLKKDNCTQDNSFFSKEKSSHVCWIEPTAHSTLGERSTN